jgi:hypothetical protein
VRGELLAGFIMPSWLEKIMYGFFVLIFVVWAGSKAYKAFRESREREW